MPFFFFEYRVLRLLFGAVSFALLLLADVSLSVGFAHLVAYDIGEQRVFCVGAERNVAFQLRVQNGCARVFVPKSTLYYSIACSIWLTISCSQCLFCLVHSSVSSDSGGSVAVFCCFSFVKFCVVKFFENPRSVGVASLLFPQQSTHTPIY